MKWTKQNEREAEIIWHREEQVLTLEGEPVLSYALAWPELAGAGLGGRWISRYYARLARSWRLRWQREVYWSACLELSQRRAASRPFTPWSGSLWGEVTRWADGLLSLRLHGEETRGDGRTNRVRWGDVWKVREGAPCRPKEFFPGKGGWRGYVEEQIVQQGRARVAAGDCLLDGDWEQRLGQHLSASGFCLTPEGVEFSLPQGVIAPAAEGTPVFRVAVDPPD